MNDAMTKSQLVNTLVILLNMTGFEGQLNKLSLAALNKMYDGVAANATAYGLANQELRSERTRRGIAEARSTSLERELRTKC